MIFNDLFTFVIGRMSKDDFSNLFKEKGYIQNMKEINESIALQNFHKNGISLVWGQYFKKPFGSKYITIPSFNEYQDSSVVLINKKKHVELIGYINQWLESFSIGYGDKEIFWLSSTLINDTFTWEPFFPGYFLSLYLFNYINMNAYSTQVNMETVMDLSCITILWIQCIYSMIL